MSETQGHHSYPKTAQREITKIVLDWLNRLFLEDDKDRSFSLQIGGWIKKGNRRELIRVKGIPPDNHSAIEIFVHYKNDDRHYSCRLICDSKEETQDIMDKVFPLSAAFVERALRVTEELHTEIQQQYDRLKRSHHRSEKSERDKIRQRIKKENAQAILIRSIEKVSKQRVLCFRLSKLGTENYRKEEICKAASEVLGKELTNLSSLHVLGFLVNERILDVVSSENDELFAPTFYFEELAEEELESIRITAEENRKRILDKTKQELASAEKELSRKLNQCKEPKERISRLLKKMESLLQFELDL